MFDKHNSLASSLVATAPADPINGTTLVVNVGDGNNFEPPFNATVWPANVIATPANSEIIRVTAIVGDSFTIQRGQEASNSRAIQAGDQIANTITPKVFTDIEGQIITKGFAIAIAIALG